MHLKERTTQRLNYLDAMRGIASLMVLGGHYINARHNQSIYIKWASMPINANDAVSFFFVLSGMVLAYSFLQNKQKPLYLKSYFISRIFRLFPGFIFALLLNALFWAREDLSFTNLQNLFLRNHFQFWEEFFMVRGYNNFYLPGWTLGIELSMSFLMPFFIVIARHKRALILPFAMVSLVVANITGIFMFHFLLGVCISAYFEEIKGTSFRNSFLFKYRYWILLLSVALFSWRVIVRISPLGSTLQYILDYMRLDAFVFSGIASAIFIIFTIHFKSIQSIFLHPILQFFGRISYGMYLFHWVILNAILVYWDDFILPYFGTEKVSFVIMFIVYAIISILGAVFIFYCIEKPFIRIGRKVTSKYQKGIQI